uniref:Uncharacterized protein n=1 Tax=Anguilla anguilla TaxID=7936 RepID=A0A0E9SK90_ANGAN
MNSCAMNLMINRFACSTMSLTKKATV